jgi:hypothetical protein
VIKPSDTLPDYELVCGRSFKLAHVMAAEGSLDQKQMYKHCKRFAHHTPAFTLSLKAICLESQQARSTNPTKETTTSVVMISPSDM